jgi:hypothetical protein
VDHVGAGRDQHPDRGRAAEFSEQPEINRGLSTSASERSLVLVILSWVRRQLL